MKHLYATNIHDCAAGQIRKTIVFRAGHPGIDNFANLAVAF